MTRSHPDPDDQLLDDLRRANPVDADALPSPYSSGPARTLETILADSAGAPGADRSPSRRRLTALPGGGRRRWISAAAAALAVAVAAVVATVVYDTGTDRDATAAVHKAAEITLQMSDSATSATTVTFDFAVLSEPWEVAIDAVFSGGDFRYRLVPGPALPELGIPDFGTQEQVFVGDQSYRLQGDGPWEGPFPHHGASSPTGPGAPMQMMLNFGVDMDDLGGLSSFMEMGEAEIDGVAATHYRTYITPAGAGAGLLMALGMFITLTGQIPPETLDDISFDVWVDSDSIVRRISYVADLDEIGAFVVVTDWDDFGSAPPVTAPAG